MRRLGSLLSSVDPISGCAAAITFSRNFSWSLFLSPVHDRIRPSSRPRGSKTTSAATDALHVSSGPFPFAGTHAESPHAVCSFELLLLASCLIFALFRQGSGDQPNRPPNLSRLSRLIDTSVTQQPLDFPPLSRLSHLSRFERKNVVEEIYRANCPPKAWQA